METQKINQEDETRDQSVLQVSIFVRVWINQTVQRKEHQDDIKKQSNDLDIEKSFSVISCAIKLS